MGVLFARIGLSIAVGVIGSGRRIGFFGAFIASLFLSPLIGGIIAALSKDKDDEARENQALKLQQQQTAALNAMQANQTARQAPENPMARAARLKKLRDDGVLTQEEFMQQIGKVDLY